MSVRSHNSGWRCAQQPVWRASALATLLLGLLLTPVVASSATASVTFHRGDDAEPTRMVWKKRPLQINLSVGRERLIEFPEPVQVGAPTELLRVLRTQIVDSTVYWKAVGSFDETRIQVKGIASGLVYLFDVSAADGAPRYPDVVIVDSRNPDIGVDATAPNAGSAWNYVTLTRHAAQQLYAPERLIGDVGGSQLFRAPVNVAPVALLRGGQVGARPLASWHGGDFYVTAVELVNRTDGTVNLDPRDLRGDWLAATFQHAWLASKGRDADTTAVYLVSAQPFDETIKGDR